VSDLEPDLPCSFCSTPSSPTLCLVEDFVVVMLEAMRAGLEQRAVTSCRRDEQGEGGKIPIVEKKVAVPANPTNQPKN